MAEIIKRSLLESYNNIIIINTFNILRDIVFFTIHSNTKTMCRCINCKKYKSYYIYYVDKDRLIVFSVRWHLPLEFRPKRTKTGVIAPKIITTEGERDRMYRIEFVIECASAPAYVPRLL